VVEADIFLQELMRNAILCVGVFTLCAGPALAQDGGAVRQPISMAGINRVAGKVDSVFIERSAKQFVVGGGDWVSYLAARLGAVPIPEPSGIMVSVDTSRILINGKMSDLPPDTRDLFGPVAMFVGPDTPLEAEVMMAPTGPGAVRFVLTAIRVNGYPVPESILSRFLAQVGARYPVLTKTGRELLVGVPVDGHVTLVQNGVRIWTDGSGAKP
jgi:hypothetical protein